MALPPFWSKLIRDNEGTPDPDLELASSGFGFAGKILSLAPLGLGIAAGVSSLNQAGGLANAGRTNTLAESGRGAGDRLRNLKQARTAMRKTADRIS